MAWNSERMEPEGRGGCGEREAAETARDQVPEDTAGMRDDARGHWPPGGSTDRGWGDGPEA